MIITYRVEKQRGMED